MSSTDTITDNTINDKENLLSMKENVPTVLDIFVGIDLLHSERSYDIILEVLVESMEHLEIYQKNLYHSRGNNRKVVEYYLYCKSPVQTDNRVSNMG